MPKLWDGVRFKLDMAEFYLCEMREDLAPAVVRKDFAYYAVSTVPQANRWAPKFYYHLDAFLGTARSVDLVITTTFGMDNILKRWIATLSVLERTNREAFQHEYDAVAANFRGNLLAHIRNVSIHRSGTPPVEVAVLGRWGMNYRGVPTQSIPTFDQPQPQRHADPNLPLSWIQPVTFAIEPTYEEFVFQEVLPDGNFLDHPLFPRCNAYLQLASRLTEDSKSLAGRIHNTQPVTPPPLYDI